MSREIMSDEDDEVPPFKKQRKETWHRGASQVKSSYKPTISESFFDDPLGSRFPDTTMTRIEPAFTFNRSDRSDPTYQPHEGFRASTTVSIPWKFNRYREALANPRRPELLTEAELMEEIDALTPLEYKARNSVRPLLSQPNQLLRILKSATPSTPDIWRSISFINETERSYGAMSSTALAYRIDDVNDELLTTLARVVTDPVMKKDLRQLSEVTKRKTYLRDKLFALQRKHNIQQ